MSYTVVLKLSVQESTKAARDKRVYTDFKERQQGKKTLFFKFISLCPNVSRTVIINEVKKSIIEIKLYHVVIYCFVKLTFIQGVKSCLYFFYTLKVIFNNAFAKQNKIA